MKRSYRKKIVLIGTPSESYAQMVSEFVRMVNESREIECVTDYALSPETMNEKMKTLKPDVILVDAKGTKFLGVAKRDTF